VEELRTRSGWRERLSDAALAAIAVMLIVTLAILASYLLPEAGSDLAGMASGMIAETPTFIALTTLGLALIVGVLWLALGQWSWGRSAAIGVGALGVAFILFLSYINCLIPHQYCSGIP
jgi:hypothetical protein